MIADDSADARIDDCADACLSCYRICADALSMHCLSVGGEHVQREHVVAMIDCSEICRTAADLLIRRSPGHRITCRACADLCAICARSCARLGGDMMVACAAACERCVASCREMSAGV